MAEKKIMFVRYINAQCVIKEFDSFRKAIEYVYETNCNKSLGRMSNNLKKRIHGQIRDAILNKEMYCGGQWIEVCKC